MLRITFKKTTVFEFDAEEDMVLDYIIARFIIKNKKSQWTKICTNIPNGKNSFLKLNCLHHEIKSIHSHFEINRTR